METKEFEYYLPPELIAQTPVEPRDSSRLLILNRQERSVDEGIFRDVVNFIKPGEVLVLNDTRVIPARLQGRLPTGGKAEVFLLKTMGEGRWEALIKPGRRLQPGSCVLFGGVEVEVLEKTSYGGRTIKFPSDEAVHHIQEVYGTIPLPPYIKTPLTDHERYQTVFSLREGSTAAPTAALHFTPRLLKELEDKGVEIVYITLHMGLTSFRPIKEEVLEEHKLEKEYFSLSPETAFKINRAKEKGLRVFACGTDAVRTLETAGQEDRLVEEGEGYTELFILPGYKFKVVDALITNLHLPRSSHLVLVSAFAGKDLVFEAYRYAIEKRFRFYSFGDVTLIL